MAEGNAGVYDYKGIKSILDGWGVKPVYGTDAKPQFPPDGTLCKTPCEATENCRIKKMHQG